MTDWTHVSPAGSRWGAAPGRFYLGNLMIRYCGGDYTALNCGFGVPLGRMEDAEARLRMFREIESQRQRAKLDDVLAERIRAIRSRATARRDSLFEVVHSSFIIHHF